MLAERHVKRAIYTVFRFIISQISYKWQIYVIIIQ